jgi:hypothetical protein
VGSTSFRRLLVVLASVLVLVLAFAPTAFAGEEDGTDTGAAGGGAGTGAGGAATAPDGSMALPAALAAGGIVLTAAGWLVVRRRTNE